MSCKFWTYIPTFPNFTAINMCHSGLIPCYFKSSMCTTMTPTSVLFSNYGRAMKPDVLKGLSVHTGSSPFLFLVQTFWLYPSLILMRKGNTKKKERKNPCKQSFLDCWGIQDESCYFKTVQELFSQSKYSLLDRKK